MIIKSEIRQLKFKEEKCYVRTYYCNGSFLCTAQGDIQVGKEVLRDFYRKRENGII